MKRSHLALAAAVALVVVVLVWAFGVGFEPAGGAGDPDGGRPGGPAASESTLSKNGDGLGVGPARALDEPGADADEARGGILSYDEDTFGLSIVRDLGEGNGLESVPGAVVHYTTAGAMEAVDWTEMVATLDRELYDVEKTAQRWGQRAVADDEGVVALPRHTGRVEVFGREGEWTGRHTFMLRRGEPTEDAVLELEPSFAILVRTVDHARRPVPGVLVAFAWETEEQGFQTWLDLPTDEKGEVVLRHLNAWDQPREVRISALIPGADPVVEDVPFGVGVEEVELEVPAVGYIEIATATPDGQPYGMFGNVIVTPLTEGAESVSKYLMGPARHRFAVFAGARFRVEAQLDYAPMTREIDGPLRGGDVVEVKFDVGARSPVIAGTIDTLKLSRRATLAAFLNVGQEPRQGFNRAIPIGPDGSFVCAMSPAWVGRKAEPGRIAFVHRAERPWVARFELPDPIPAGTVPVGRLVPEPMNEIVGGTILVDGRRPDFTVRLSLQQQELEEDKRVWRDVRSWDVNHRGRFGFYGDMPTAPLQIVVTAPSVLPVPPRPVQAGDTDLVFELSSGGDARMAVEPDYDSLQVTGRLVPETNGVELAGRRRDARLTADQDGARFRWQAVPAGSYRVDVFLRSASEPVVSISGLEIVGGQESEWPALDLQRHIDIAVLNVTDAQGGVPEKHTYLLLADSHDENGSSTGFVRGMARVELRRGSAAPALVVAAGYDVEPVTLRGGAQSVQLRPWQHTVELRVGAAMRTAFPNVRWRAYLTGPGGALDAIPERLRQNLFARFAGLREAHATRFVADFDAAGRIRQSVPMQGPWSIELIGVAGVGDAARVYRDVVAKDVTAGGVVEVSLTPEQMAAAREKLR